MKNNNAYVDIPSNIRLRDEHMYSPHSRHLDLGFGSGDSLIYYAHNCNCDYVIGIEKYTKGIQQSVRKIIHHKLHHVFLHYGSIEHFLLCLPSYSINSISLLFSDPWPKNRHCNRRVIQGDFLHHISHILVSTGYFDFVTDCVKYMEWFYKIFSDGSFENVFFLDKNSFNFPLTRYRLKGCKTFFVRLIRY